MAARPLAVFDLDGTLADVRHRLPLLRRRPKDWDGFFAAAPADPPLPDGIALALSSAEDHEIAYVTGRPERCRRDTVARTL
jgi:FMN phosphatase YigB (HAD superfamily)